MGSATVPGVGAAAGAARARATRSSGRGCNGRGRAAGLDHGPAHCSSTAGPGRREQLRGMPLNSCHAVQSLWTKFAVQPAIET